MPASSVAGGHGAASASTTIITKVPFADAPDGVAAHLAQRLRVVRSNSVRQPMQGGQCGFGAGMAAADDDDVEFLRCNMGRKPGLDRAGRVGGPEFRFAALRRGVP